jgi:hypothetical protein
MLAPYRGVLTALQTPKVCERFFLKKYVF